MGADLVIRRARVGADPGAAPVDVRVAEGRIVEVSRSSGPAAGADELDASGGWLIPGLHDHHLHLRSLAASRTSVTVGPPEVTNLDEMADALRRASAAGRTGWIRAVGYHESVAGELDRDALDRLAPGRPLRVQHRSGVLWVLNSRALEVVGADSVADAGVERDGAGRPTGRLWRMDAWLAERTGALGGLGTLELKDRLAELSREAAGRGVTGWTDATPERSDEDTSLLERASAEGVIRPRLHLMVRTGLPAGGCGPAGGGLLSRGAVKVILDDFDLPDIEWLSGVVRAAHYSGRPVAIHCVTRVQLVLTLAALDEAGGSYPGDRIEHGAVIPAELIPRLRQLGLTVVTQPNFVAERGDEYLRSVEPAEMENLWRAGSLVRAGVAVAGGTDAPFGSADPWAAIRAATSRRTASGAVVGPAERVDVAEAVRWWQGTGPEPAAPRQVGPGEPADLVVLPVPVSEFVVAGRSPEVIATVIAGEVVHA